MGFGISTQQRSEEPSRDLSDELEGAAFGLEWNGTQDKWMIALLRRAAAELRRLKALR